MKSRIVTGAYIEQSIRAKFNQYQSAVTVCHLENEDMIHMLLLCSVQRTLQNIKSSWTVSNFDGRASVTKIFQDLGWRTFDQRRTDARLCLFYKSLHGLVAEALPEYIQCSNRVSRYCHSMTFRQASTSTDYYTFLLTADSFFPLAIVQWNALPQSVACLQSLEVFNTAVCKIATFSPLDPI